MNDEVRMTNYDYESSFYIRRSSLCNRHSTFVIRYSAMAGWLIAFGVLFVLLALSCQKNSSTYQERMIVYTTLDPRLAHQTVIVDRSYSVDESAPESVGVSGAIVKLWQEGSPDTAQLEDIERRGFYQDTLTVPAIQGCSTYRIAVQWQSFSGEDSVTVPDTFHITRPLPGDTLDTTSLPTFTWTPSKSAVSYLAYITALNPRQWSPFHQERPLSRPIRSTADSLDIRSLAQTIFDTTGVYRLRVYALDAHLDQAETQGSDLDSIGLNTLGNCGAQASDSLRFVLR